MAQDLQRAGAMSMSSSRRRFLGGMLAAGASAAILKHRRAEAAPAGAVYPTIFIQLRGGWDPAQHLCARVGLPNREVSSTTLKKTTSGIYYHDTILSAMAPHLEQAVVVRNLNMGQTDHHIGPQTLWYGDYATESMRMPWVNYLASKLLDRAPAPIANVTAYWERDNSDSKYVSYNNKSPNKLAAAQRILNISGFASTLDVSQGLPPVGQQQQLYDFIGRADDRLYSPKVQPGTIQAFDQANAQANDLLGKTLAKVWPPDAATMTLLGLTAADLTATGYQGIPGFKAMCGLAFQLARTQASHVISFTGDKELDYDSHTYNISTQRNTGQRYFASIAKLLSALKATPSPVEAGKTMFDTTHVVISSEMGRSPNAENGSGTFHWPWTHVAMFGGNFKRGFAFGDLDSGLMGVPADFDSGALNTGVAPRWLNVVSTIMKVNGVDPTGFDPAKPLNAVIR